MQKLFRLMEPAATTHPAEMDIFRESINESVKGIDAKFVVHACFSGNDYKALAPQMPEIKAEHTRWNLQTVIHGMKVLMMTQERDFSIEIVSRSMDSMVR